VELEVALDQLPHPKADLLRRTAPCRLLSHPLHCRARARAAQRRVRLRRIPRRGRRFGGELLGEDELGLGRGGFRRFRFVVVVKEQGERGSADGRN
jgi:hypothetical protein